MTQFSELDRTVSRIAVADGLLKCVEVNSTIDGHGHLLRGLMRKVSFPELTRELEVRALSHENLTERPFYRAQPAGGPLLPQPCPRAANDLTALRQ